MPRQVCVKSFVPKLKKLRRLRYFVSCERTTRHFDHRTNQVIQLYIFFLHTSFAMRWTTSTCSPILLKPDERNHNFGIDLDPRFLNLRRGFKDGTGLHLRNLRINNP